MFSTSFQMALRGDLKAYERAVAAANTSAIRTVTNRFKTQARRQVERAGLGVRLGNAIRGEVRTPAGADITMRGVCPDPRGRAFTRDSKTGLDLIAVFERGVTIHGKPFLAIPTAQAGGRRAKSPESYPEGTFRYVPLRKGRGRPKANRAIAVLIHKQRQELWYSLVPVVRLKKRLRLQELYQRQVASIPRTLEAAYTRQFRRLGVLGAHITARAA